MNADGSNPVVVTEKHRLWGSCIPPGRRDGVHVAAQHEGDASRRCAADGSFLTPGGRTSRLEPRDLLPPLRGIPCRARCSRSPVLENSPTTTPALEPREGP